MTDLRSLRISFLLMSILTLLGISLFHESSSAQCSNFGYGYQPASCVRSFVDVEYSPYGEAIYYVSQSGIVKGYSDGSYRPRLPVNRAEFSKILAESVLGNPSAEGGCFSDVPSDQWFSSYVCALEDRGIIGGYPDGTFRPTNQVNVAEGAKILANLFDLNVRAQRSGEQWFVPFIEALANRGALPGTFTGPGHLLTRAEMAELVLRLRERISTRPSLTLCDVVPESCSSYRELSDVQTHPAAESIEFLLRRGLVSGYEDGTFRPWDVVNRAEMLKFLIEAQSGSAAVSGENGNCFTDVRREWFAPYVCRAKRRGVVNGYPDGSFHPGQEVRKIEALKMALEAYGVDLPAVPAGSEWYRPYVLFAHDNNLFSRFSYVPDAVMNRGDVALLIHGLIANESELVSFIGARDSRSLGCGLPAPTSKLTFSMVNGVRQEYILDVPSSYDPSKPLALTFAWHGRTNSNSRVRTYYKVYEAAKGQTIMVYPAGTGPWNLDRDVAIFDHLLGELSSIYCVDMDRIYMVGHSLGAWFTNSLSCIRGDKIRASGSLGGGTSQRGCSGPVAAITMHNPDDRLSSFAQGIQARDLHLQQNQCSEATASYPSPDQANCVQYTQCAPDAPVVWCPHTEDYSFGYYYPHGWPKWTGSEIWDFFESLDEG